MIARALSYLVDSTVGVFSPQSAVRRAHARSVQRGYQGAEANRLNNHKRPQNKSANSELAGPWGADALRAWARSLVRDNAYAWSALEAIVSETIGTGFGVESNLETDTGQDEEDTNENRDKIWQEWCKVCDLHGQLTFDEIQTLAFREMVEAGECLIRYVPVPLRHKGIMRPVPLAIELIEADRLASDNDTYAIGRRNQGYRITRGVEMDEEGTVLAYHIYPAHPTEPNVFARTPERIDAKQIRHLFRKDRIGQSRGVTWFAPVVQWLRDMGYYVDNELQASAVASCFVAAIKTDTPMPSLGQPPSLETGETSNTSDSDGNSYGYIQPGMFTQLAPHEDIEFGNPGRPNASAEPWIQLMLRGIAAGTGTSYESVSKDFSNTSYSSSRTSKLENRPRYRRWQGYWKSHLCEPTWFEFCQAAARAGLDEFPTATELLEDFTRYAPVEFAPPVWEWVDIKAEQESSENAINALQSTLKDELGPRGKNWRHTLYQSAKEKALKDKLGLITPADAQTAQMAGQGMQSEAQAMVTLADGTVVESETGDATEAPDVNVAATALNGAQVTSLMEIVTQVGAGTMTPQTATAVIGAAFPTLTPQQVSAIVSPVKPGSISVDGASVVPADESAAEETTGEMAGLSTQQFNRNRKAIDKVLNDLASGEMSEAKARMFLESIGMKAKSIDVLIADALDGSVDELPEATETVNA